MHKDKLGEYRVVTSSGYELYTLTLDFLAKHPFDLAAAPDAFPEDIYKTAMETLFASRTILTATDWAKSSNSKMHRPLMETITRPYAELFSPPETLLMMCWRLPSLRPLKMS